MRFEAWPTKDVWVSLALLCVAAFYGYNTFGYSEGTAPGLPNARTLPLVLTAVLTLLALVIFARALVAARPGASAPAGADAEEDPEDARLVEAPSLARLGVLLALLVVYLLLMPRVGFLVATVAFGVAVQALIFRSRLLSGAIVAVAMAGLGYWIFASLLDVPLP